MLVVMYVYFNVSNESERIVEQAENLNLPEESLEKKENGENIIKKGSFNRIDQIHYAQGEAIIKKGEDGRVVLKFENFKAANGPDLFVYLSKNRNIDTIKEDLGETVSLGELKKIEGEQIYSLPDDYSDFNSVVIWCRAFDVNFSAANLNKL